MITSNLVKEFILKSGADACGIASVSRFVNAPKGFHPADIYTECQSVIVFLKQMPTEIIKAANPVPYTHTAYLLYAELDRISLTLSVFLQKNGVHGIPVPADVPYLYWDEEKKHGQGILSLRHSAFLAGLGILGRSSLLIHQDLGNMVYIGAVLTNAVLEPDALVEDFSCPPNCSICIDSCPVNALDGVSVNQKLCRQISFYQNERGFDIYDCNACRRLCVLRTGKKH